MTWEDPLPALMRAREMSGLEYLRAIQDGRIPMSPIGALVDMRLVEVSDGRAVFELKPAEFHYNPIGSVHGASRRRCWIRRWAAPSIRCCRVGSHTRRWS